MDFSIPPQLLLVIASAIVLLSALGARIVRDANAINQTNKLNRQLIKVGRSRLKTGTSVIIELGKKADTVTPLLDHLYEQAYPKLEIIVIIKQTAGKNARPTLARFKRAHPGMQLRIVSHKAGRTTLETIRRFATKPLVMTISADQRLSPNFFSHISADYALERPDRIIPPRYGMLDNTLSSAIAARAIFLNSGDSVIPSPELASGIVYKRTSLYRQQKVEHAVLSQSAYTLTPSSAKPSLTGGLTTPRITWRKLTLIIAAILGITYVGLSLPSSDMLALLGLILGVSVFMYAITLVGLKAYSLIDKVSLVLLSPIFMIYRTVSYIRAIILPRKKYS